MTAGFGYGRVCRVVRPSSCSARSVGVLWTSTSSAFQCGRACITLGPVLHREALRYYLFIFGPTGCVWEGLHHDLTALPFDIREPTASPCASVSLIALLCLMRQCGGSRCQLRSGAAHCHCMSRRTVRGTCLTFKSAFRAWFAHDVMLGIPPVFRRIGHF